MCSFIKPHKATDDTHFEGAWNWNADCRNVYRVLKKEVVLVKSEHDSFIYFSIYLLAIFIYLISFTCAGCWWFETHTQVISYSCYSCCFLLEFSFFASGFVSKYLKCPRMSYHDIVAMCPLVLPGSMYRIMRQHKQEGQPTFVCVKRPEGNPQAVIVPVASKAYTLCFTWDY